MIFNDVKGDYEAALALVVHKYNLIYRENEHQKKKSDFIHCHCFVQWGKQKLAYGFSNN